MNIAIIPEGEIYLRNRLFDENARLLNRDNCNENYILFKSKMKKLGHSVNTYDLFDPKEIDILIVHRIDFMIRHLLKVLKKNSTCRLFYIMSEPPIICKLHSYKYLREFNFERIFTWNDSEINKSTSFVKLNYVNPVIIPERIPLIAFAKKKFIASIVGNKKSSFPNELYSKRLEVAEYFSRQPLGFDLYGMGWETTNHEWIKRIWKGEVVSKIDVLKEYKFTLCFENSSGYNGYITEKIFDAFAAGSVPVYYGAPNITDYIPKSAFIDFRDFESIYELHQYLSNIQENEYLLFLSSAKQFIRSNNYLQFCSPFFSECLSKHILIDNGKTINYIELRLKLFLGLFKKIFLIRHIRRYFYEVLTYI